MQEITAQHKALDIQISRNTRNTQVCWHSFLPWERCSLASSLTTIAPFQFQNLFLEEKMLWLNMWWIHLHLTNYFSVTINSQTLCFYHGRREQSSKLSFISGLFWKQKGQTSLYNEFEFGRHSQKQCIICVLCVVIAVCVFRTSISGFPSEKQRADLCVLPL